MTDYFLADDLSGALDAAAAFHHAGRRVRIVLGAESWRLEPDDDVVAVTTETRNASPDLAAQTVSRAIAHAQALAARLVYKKIDSTLRGPVAAEVAALAAALPGARILFTPANPAVGRTVRGGVLLVRGVPVAQTEFGRDPTSPVTESSIFRLLAGVASDRVDVADVESESDLAAAVEWMARTGKPWVAVGSGALARPVARWISRGTNTRGAASEAVGAPTLGEPAAKPGPALFVCGSAHPGNREQAAVLARDRGVAAYELNVDAPTATVDAAIARLRAGQTVAVLADARRSDSRAVLRAVTATTEQIIAATDVRRLFVTGGETAFALCAALEIPALEFQAEIEPGLSLSRTDAAGARGAGFTFAIKPGGFGDDRTWVRAAEAMEAS